MLIVDDERLVRAMLRRALARLGCEVTEASSATEALEVWATATPRPQLVLTDIDMPHGDGFELAAALGGKASPPAVVFISGSSDGLERARAAGYAIIPKPVAIGEIVSVLTRSLAAHQSLDA